MTFRAAFYKGTRPGLQSMYSQGVRMWEKCPYSHGELVFRDGWAGSASYIDGGVRLKKIDFKPSHWDWIILPDHMEDDAREWFEVRNGKVKYDLVGQFRFVIPVITIGNNSEKEWCTKAMASSMKYPEPWRFGPERLFNTMSIAYRELQPR